MTREEAIQICKEVRHCLWIADEQKTTTIWDKGAVSEAMLMAIEALKRESFENDTKIKSCSKDSDLISRNEAFEVLAEILDENHVPIWICDKMAFAIDAIPPADRPRGEWIDKEELIDAINDAQFVYDSDEGGHKEYDITELVRVIFKDIISNLSSADMRGEDE